MVRSISSTRATAGSDGLNPIQATAISSVPIDDSIPILVSLTISEDGEVSFEPHGQTRWLAIKVRPAEETLDSLKAKLVELVDALDGEDSSSTDSSSTPEVEFMYVRWDMSSFQSRQHDAHTHIDFVDEEMFKRVLELMVVRKSQDWLEVGITI